VALWSFCKAGLLCAPAVLYACVVQDAVVLIKDIAEADKAAEQLVHEAYQRGSNDNISCVVLKFKF
jgi:serine/threonine protein phosphatase PrpC